MTVTKEMIDRFLSWKLPDDFSPDAGISFKKVYNEQSPFGPSTHEPTGTNLLNAEQARQMLEHVLAAPPQAPSGQQAEALRRIKYEAVSLADAQVIALEALAGQQSERPAPAAGEQPPDCWWIDRGTYGRITMDKGEADRAREEGAKVYAYTYLPAPAVQQARDLSDKDMDAVQTAIKELEAGDIGYHAFCDRILAIASPAPAGQAVGAWRVDRTFSTHNHPTRFWETSVVNQKGELVCRTAGASQEEAESLARQIASSQAERPAVQEGE